MSPAERAEWCRQQADEIEHGLGPRPEADDLMPVQFVLADWFRDMADHLADRPRAAA